MRILIVEDDPHKMSQLKREVLAFDTSIEINLATSLQGAMDSLTESQFDAVLLDMAIPSHAGDATATDVYSQPVGGLDILLYLHEMCRPEKVIVMTQYPTIEYNRQHVPLRKVKEKLESDGVENLVAVTLFADDSNWAGALTNFLQGVS